MNMEIDWVARVVKNEKDWEKALLDKYGYGKKGKGGGKGKGKGEAQMCPTCGKEVPSLVHLLHIHRCGEEVEIRGEEEEKETEPEGTILGSSQTEKSEGA
jgi:hypothetical protein